MSLERQNLPSSCVRAACNVCSAFSWCRSTYRIDLGYENPSSYTFFHFRGSHRGLGRIPPILAHEDSQVSSICYATMPIVDIIQLGLTTLVERLTPMASRTSDSPTKSVTSGASKFLRNFPTFFYYYSLLYIARRTERVCCVISRNPNIS